MSNKINQLMEEAQKMQQKMQEIQNSIQNALVTGKAGGNMIEWTLNGKYYAQNVKILPEAMKEKPEVFADLLIAAHNDAVKKVEAIAKDKMAPLANFQLPDNISDLFSDDDK